MTRKMKACQRASCCSYFQAVNQTVLSDGNPFFWNVVHQHVQEGGLAAVPGAEYADGERGLGLLDDFSEGGHEDVEAEAIFGGPDVA